MSTVCRVASTVVESKGGVVGGQVKLYNFHQECERLLPHWPANAMAAAIFSVLWNVAALSLTWMCCFSRIWHR